MRYCFVRSFVRSFVGAIISHVAPHANVCRRLLLLVHAWRPPSACLCSRGVACPPACLPARLRRNGPLRPCFSRSPPRRHGPLRPCVPRAGACRASQAELNPRHQCAALRCARCASPAPHRRRAALPGTRCGSGAPPRRPPPAASHAHSGFLMAALGSGPAARRWAAALAEVRLTGVVAPLSLAGPSARPAAALALVRPAPPPVSPPD